MKVGLEKRKLKLGRLDRRLLKKKNTDLLHAKCAHHIALLLALPLELERICLKDA